MVSVVSLYIIVYQRAFTFGEIIAQRIFAYEKAAAFATANETLTTNCVHVHGPAPKASIIRKSASIIAIVTLLKMIGIVPKLVRSFMKPLIAQINPIMDKTTDPTNSTSELDGAVNSI